MVDVAADAGRAGIYLFKASGSVMKFPGHRAIYMEGRDDTKEEDGEILLPSLVRSEVLEC